MFALVISANAQAKFGVQGAMSLAKMANGGSGESILSWQAGVVFDYDFQSNLYLSTGRSLRRILHRQHGISKPTRNITERAAPAGFPFVLSKIILNLL